MNWIKSLLVSAMLTLSRYMPNAEYVNPEDTVQTEVEPEKEMDEWNQWLHHDDVTPDEIAMLYCDDPLQIMMAQEAIAIRQQEFQDFWDDPVQRKEAFWGGGMPVVDMDRPQTPMNERPGWEDDELPETFSDLTDIDLTTMEPRQIRFDDLPEWTYEPDGPELLAQQSD